MQRLAVLTAVAALAAACTPAAEAPADQTAGTEEPVTTGPAPDPSAGDPTGEVPTDSRPVVTLQAMHFDEFSTVIEPGLGCAFEGGDAVLLVASGADSPSGGHAGVVKINGQLMRLTSSETGGYDALVDGAAFSDARMTVTVRLSGDAATEGYESTSRNGDLVLRYGSTERSYPGAWTCGA